MSLVRFRNWAFKIKYGCVAQLVEHLTFNQVVPGSNPGTLTLKNTEVFFFVPWFEPRFGLRSASVGAKQRSRPLGLRSAAVGPKQTSTGRLGNEIRASIFIIPPLTRSRGSYLLCKKVLAFIPVIILFLFEQSCEFCDRSGIVICF